MSARDQRYRERRLAAEPGAHMCDCCGAWAPLPPASTCPDHRPLPTGPPPGAPDLGRLVDVAEQTARYEGCWCDDNTVGNWPEIVTAILAELPPAANAFIDRLDARSDGAEITDGEPFGEHWRLIGSKRTEPMSPPGHVHSH